LSQDGGKSSVQLFHSLSEFEVVVIELSSLNVHDVEGDRCKFINSSLELNGDLVLDVGQGFTFGVTQFNLLELGELDDSAGQMHDVLASL